MYTITKPLRVALAVLASVVALSALAGGAAAILLPEKPAWTAVGFELVTLVAAVLGIVMAGNRFREGPALALACIGGTILVSSGLGYLASGASGQAGDAQVRLALAARIALALAISFLGAWNALGRRPLQWKLAVHGGALAIAGPVLGLLHRQTDGNWFTGPEGGSLGMIGLGLLGLTLIAFAVTSVFAFVRSGMCEPGDTSGSLTRFVLHMLPPGAAGVLAAITHGHINTPLTGMSDVIKVTLSIVLVIFLGGWFCGGVHMLIRAFEMGRGATASQSANPA